MSLSLKKQQHHINQLLSTAAGGTGVVNDVDALLTPIGMSAVTTTLRTEPKAERNLWREEEMLQMLHLMLKANAIEMLNDKSVKSEKVFRNIEKLMFDSGYRKKSYNQIWTKWKFLKSTYMTSRRAGVVPKMIPPSIYKVLDTILRNASSVSVCGGNSNGGGGSSLDGYNSDSGRLIISHVESGSLTNGFARSNKKQSNGLETGDSNKDTEDDSFGMAHPIFGFRLGIVKPEPIDTDYENPPINGTLSDDQLDNNNANSLASSPPNEDLQTEIKQEADEIEENNSQHKPHGALRGTATPASATPPPQHSTPIAPFSQRDSQMPPLRIAPFAKASQFNIQRQQQPRRSPPPLSMHPVMQQKQQHLSQQQQSHRHFTRHSQGHSTPAGQSTISVNNNNSNIRIQRMLMSKPVHQHQQHRIISTSTTGTQIRLPREITIHSTSRPPVNATIPRLKQIAKRMSYEAHQIESVLPDMDSDIILQQQKQQQLAMSFEPSSEGPCTSQQAKLKNRKRRLKLPPMDVKCAKVLKTYSTAKQQERSYQDNDYYSNLRCSLSGREMDNANQGEMFSRLDVHATKQSQEKINQQHRQKHFEQQQKKTQKKKDEDYFDEALKDLGKSLRVVQRQVISEFFEKQMEMARKEHEFQAKQDKLLMEAFEEQTQLIMRSAKTLLGIDLPGLNKQSQSEEKPEDPAKKASSNDEEQKENAEYVKHQEQEEDIGEVEEESIEPYYQQDEEGDDENDENDDADDAEDNDENDNDSDTDDDGDDDEAEGEEEEEGAEQDGQNEDYLDDNNDEEDEQDENEYEDSDHMDPCADPIELVSSELVEDTS